MARLRREIDPGAASRRQPAAQVAAAEDRERRVCEALAITEALAAEQHQRARARAERAAKKGETDGGGAGSAPDPAKEPRASTTDAQARVMKMADGGFRPAYNVQFAADTRSMAVAGVSVDNVGSDMGKMAPMTDALAAAYGRRPSQRLADGGFAKLKDIEELTQAGVVTYLPVPVPRDRTRDRGMRQRPGPQPRPHAVPGARRRQGQGGRHLARLGPQYGLLLASGIRLIRRRPSAGTTGEGPGSKPQFPRRTPIRRSARS